MPVYNVERYLEDSIRSVLAQSIGFKKHVQLILIDDGSTDNSADICKRYAKQYPDNITYLYQNNAGVSAARNRGIQNVTGRYISFMDSDDLLSRDTARQVCDFFERHDNDIDVVSIKLTFFESKTGDHMLNYKFDRTRVIDINKEYSAVQLSGGSAFVKTSAVKGKHKFDEGMEVGEDAKFLTELILKKQRYGVLSEPVYWYRRRYGSDSALAKSDSSRSWYINTVQSLHLYLIEHCIERFGHVPRYVQYLLMYDLQWRFSQRTKPSVLSSSETSEYVNNLRAVLNRIDEDIILEQKFISPAVKSRILYEKNGSIRSIDYKKVYSKSNPWVLFDFIEVTPSFIRLEGRINIFHKFKPSLKIIDKGVHYSVETVPRPNQDSKFLGELVSPSYGFKIEIPRSHSKEEKSLRAELEIGQNSYKLPIGTLRFTGVNPLMGRGFSVKSKMIVSKTKYTLDVVQYSIVSHIKKEMLYEASLLKNAKQNSVFIRWAYYALRPFVRKKIWLISDRTTAGGDNGDALFQYISHNGHPSNVVPYFVLFKSSPDYERIKKLGKVIDRASIKYRFWFLLSDKIISSHADDFVINPFGDKVHDLCDLYTFDFVFLQHGVTKDDISAWLGRYSKNIRLFVTAAKQEQEWIMDERFGYGDKQVKKTGFPRFDLLENRPNKKVIFAPTWRNKLLTTQNVNGVWQYDPHFTSTKYYQFYNLLINDHRIIHSLRKANMTGELYVHPSFAGQVDDFVSNDVISIKSPPYDYKEAFREGSVLVTDYSSVAFDFAYLRKPVLYTQFDKDDFFSKHLYKEGYYSYEKDGFGPIATNLEEAVKGIVRLIDADGKLEKRYDRRIDNFFGQTDKQNSKRVFNEILAIDEDDA